MRIIDYSPIERTLTIHPQDIIHLEGHIRLNLTTRGCVGSWKNGEYKPCDNPTAPFCDRCKEVWPCAICTGHCTKPLHSCNEPHSIYFALFAPGIVKVGVTRKWRLKERLQEQGADIGVEIAQAEDGRVARLIESEIGKQFTERVRFETKLAGITKPADESTLYDALSNLLNGGTFAQDFEVGELMHFEYFDRVLWMQPILIQPEEDMVLEGDVVGIQGKMLVLERFDTLYVINLHNLLGYDIYETDTVGNNNMNRGKQKRKYQLQTSIHAFA